MRPSFPSSTRGASVVPRALLFVLSVLALAGSVGCVKVAPYERGALAHPTMLPEGVESAMDEHVRAVSEGATGGVSGGGGGCGCN